jgi:NADPH-dependent curcumin reductase CurA
MVNRQFVLARRPVGMVKESDFRMVELPVPVPQDGEVLLKARYLSVDPYMRGRMNAAKSYAPPVDIGGLMVGAGVAEVLESKNTGFSAGDIVVAPMGWQEYAISNGVGLRRVDVSAAPVSTALGVLGMTGLTAHLGLHDVCAIKPFDTVVVSGAAGAVGSIAVQIAKLAGCRVVGIAGGPRKVEYLVQECGIDAALDYKAIDDYAAGLRELCPQGIDAYFDNVGGPISDAVVTQLNPHARVAICGQIAQYNDPQPSVGPRLMRHILVARAKVQGFLIFDYSPAETAPALAELTGWVRAGKIKYHEDIVEGFENMPRALIGLFLGENIGKRVVKVA